MIAIAENELQFFSGDYIASAQRALKVGDEFEKLAGFHFLVYIGKFEKRMLMPL